MKSLRLVLTKLRDEKPSNVAQEDSLSCNILTIPMQMKDAETARYRAVFLPATSANTGREITTAIARPLTVERVILPTMVSAPPRRSSWLELLFVALFVPTLSYEFTRVVVSRTRSKKQRDRERERKKDELERTMRRRCTGNGLYKRICFAYRRIYEPVGPVLCHSTYFFLFSCPFRSQGSFNPPGRCFMISTRKLSLSLSLFLSLLSPYGQSAPST